MSIILVDTSIWIDHLRNGSVHLDQLLFDRSVLIHDHVIGELMMGSLHGRANFVEFLLDLPKLENAFDYEVRELIEKREIYSRGIGYSDAHLLASVFLNGTAKLWTLDRRLGDVCSELSIKYEN